MTWLEKHQKACADLRLAKRYIIALARVMEDAGNDKISTDLYDIAELVTLAEKGASDSVGLLLIKGMSAEFQE